MMKLLDNLPPKFKVKWILVWLKSSALVLIAISLSLGVGALAGAQVSASVLPTYLLAVTLNIFVVLLGFLGASQAFLITEMALIASSFIAGLFSCIDYAGWEALVSIYIVILMTLPAGIVGLVTELIKFLRRNQEGFSEKTQTRIWRFYALLLGGLMIAAPFSLDFEHTAYESIPQPEVEIEENQDTSEETLERLIFQGGTAEYGFFITVTQDEVVSETFDRVPDYEADSGDGEKKTNVIINNRSLSKGEFETLQDYMKNETDFLSAKEDLSTSQSILDAESATITLEYKDHTIRKGGYYPYDTLSFKKLSDYVRRMQYDPDKQAPHYASQIDALTHPDEKAVLYILQGLVSELESVEKTALSITPMYDSWSYDAQKNRYTVHIELESEYESGTGFAQGKLQYALDDHTLKFKKDLFSITLENADLSKRLLNHLLELDVLD